MKWLKNRYDQLILAVVAVALLVFAGMVLVSTGSFSNRFSGVTKSPRSEPQGTVIVVRPDPEPLASHSAEWTPGDGKDRGSLFVSPPYIALSGQPPKKAIDVVLWHDSLTGRDIPNQWFITHHLPYLKSTDQFQDPDKDGFTNEDEFRADTNPNDPNSHPPYLSRLFFKHVVRTPVIVDFASVNGDRNKPQTLVFQINTPRLNRETLFLKIGDPIPNTHLKLAKFEWKTVFNPKINGDVDVSELTVVNIETGDAAVLVLNIPRNVPEEHAVFDYQWPPAAGEIPVKKLQSFGLRPETDKTKLYKLIDIRETEAVIQTPDQLEYTVVRDPRRSTR